MTILQLLEKKWFASLAVALLAFFGALGGSTVTGMFQLNQLEIQIKYEKNKTILEQRVKLLEKLSRLANAAGQMRTYNDYLVLQANIQQAYVICQQSREVGCIKPDDVKSIVEANFKRVELNSEYSSTLQLIKVYFSPSIRPILSDLASRKDWWAPDVEAKFRALVDVASNEIEAL